MDKRMEGFYWEASWCPKQNRQRRLRRASIRRLSKCLRMARESLRRYLRQGGYYRGKLRSGLCDYCYHHEVYERPRTENILQKLAQKIRELGSSAFTEWEARVAGHEQWTQSHFDRTGSPEYLLAMEDFLRGHAHYFASYEYRDLVDAFFTKFKEGDGPLAAARSIQAHWQCRDNQNAELSKVAEPELLPDDILMLACDYGERLKTLFFTSKSARGRIRTLVAVVRFGGVKSVFYAGSRG